MWNFIRYKSAWTQGWLQIFAMEQQYLRERAGRLDISFDFSFVDFSFALSHMQLISELGSVE